MRTRRMLAGAAALALATTLAGPAGAGNGPQPRPARAPDGIGAYAVGRSTFEVSDPARAGRTLTVDVWYPADARDAAASPASVLDLLVAQRPLDYAKADPDPSRRGPFPLVVFSHGSGGVRFQSWFLMESLASHGFVVAAPDHAGNTSLDALFGTSDPFPVVAYNRPLDVRLVIDRMLARSADPGDPLAGVIDGNRIGVAGHSFGGFTALAVAGGFADIPPDPRVDAIVPISGASTAITDAALRGIRIPVLFLSGTSDVTVPIDPGTTRPWGLISSQHAYRADLLRAGHASFTNVCDLLETLIDAGLPPVLLEFLISQAEEGCAPELIPIEEAQRLTNLYTNAFLRTHLGPDHRDQVFLTEQYARRAGLEVVFEARHGRRAA